MDYGEIETNREEITEDSVPLSKGLECVSTYAVSNPDQHDSNLKASITHDSNSEDCPKVSEELSLESKSQDLLPQYFEFVMDDSLPSNAFYTPKEENSANSFEAGTNSVDLSFLATEDSVSISDAHFIPFDNPTSSSFNESRQVACNDSMESSQSTSPNFFDSKTHLERDDLPTAEDSSLDSGLGSVDSVYENSGEESASSPDVSSAISSPEAVNSSKNDEETESLDRFYDCAEESEIKAGVKRHMTGKHEWF